MCKEKPTEVNYNVVQGKDALKIELLRFETAKLEYSRQVEDFKSLDLKGSFLIALLVAVVTILSQILGKTARLNDLAIVMYYIIIVISLCCFVGAVLSIAAFRMYKLNSNAIINEQISDYKEFVIRLTASYSAYTDFNRNTYRAKNIIYMITSFFVIVDISLMIIFVA